LTQKFAGIVIVVEATCMLREVFLGKPNRTVESLGEYVWCLFDHSMNVLLSFIDVNEDVVFFKKFSMNRVIRISQILIQNYIILLLSAKFMEVKCVEMQLLGIVTRIVVRSRCSIP
jgi:hypothetical protein